jgi:hypothetical protein
VCWLFLCASCCAVNQFKIPYHDFEVNQRMSFAIGALTIHRVFLQIFVFVYLSGALLISCKPFWLQGHTLTIGGLVSDAIMCGSFNVL